MITSLSNINQLDGLNDEIIDKQIATTPPPPPLPQPEPKELLNYWYDVCTTTECSLNVKEFSLATNSEETKNLQIIKKQLESGVTYKFRVAAINACGRGNWSEVASFTTSLPGFPGAPTSVKIKNNENSAILSWEPPVTQVNCTPVDEYIVYLCVKIQPKLDDLTKSNQQYTFYNIYNGSNTYCEINSDLLSRASIDNTSKPALLLRISAKNDKGYGPATQVRWLQGKSLISFRKILYFKKFKKKKKKILMMNKIIQFK